MQKWINEIPNDGLIYYNYLFNAERLLITSPKALGEVLVQKNYEFIKPEAIRHGLGRILGVGVLLAEGEEHKVRVLVACPGVVANGRPDPTQKPHASICLPSH
jgi:hypothetical protein